MTKAEKKKKGSLQVSLEIFDLELLIQVVGITGLILTKLDGSARGGCVVCFNVHLNHNFVWSHTLYFLASPFLSLFLLYINIQGGCVTVISFRRSVWLMSLASL